MFALAKPDPAWLTLYPAVEARRAAKGRPASKGRPAVEVRFSPITIAGVRAARRAVAASLQIDADDLEMAGDAMSRELIRRGILEWRGIGDDEGNTVPVTPETIEAFVADPRTFEPADRLYVMPFVRADMEGNVSSASPSGTGKAETQEANTAPQSADGAKTAAAAPTKRHGKKAAPTSSTNRRRSKATLPGT
ncbi:hypothetical protein [Sphingomonas sp. CROZ-RG-20F-R02-07]|uniref:hypothetical protein n=1 Tax=Sphingomonas sp. CROZ-RG-20F-R02-07 TaxID=2914832 RepID=UPI001F59853C|nr:hypothetical protein [Sphingomonas sp. CROZ-RG-20F-R02-07]